MAIFITSTVRKKRGFTLTELAIVIGIMGAILGAIWVAAAQVNANNKAQKAAGQVLTILNGYKGFFGLKGGIDFTGWQDITCLGVNAGFFPSDMLSTVIPCVPSGTPNNTFPSSPWGTSGGGQWVRVIANPFAQNFIQIGYGGLSQSACINLTQAIVSNDAVDEVINGNQQSINGYKGGGAPWTAAQINGYCVAGNANYVYVSWPVQ